MMKEFIFNSINSKNIRLSVLLPVLFFVQKIQRFAIITCCHQQCTRHNINIVQLCISKRIHRFSVFYVGDVHINFWLIHFARKLWQDLNTNHTMFDRTLKKIAHIFHNVSKHHFVFVTVEPTVFGYLSNHGNQRLDNEIL